MKRCPKRAVEPQRLADFRGAQPSATWDDLRNEARACYDEIRAQTRADQGGLCAWCETVLTTTNEQIAHFHPKSDKSGPRNWGLDWGNLWLACKGGTQAWLTDLKLHPLPENRSCDEHKEDRCLDGMVLTPGEIPAFPPIFRYDRRPDGRLDLAADEDACLAAGIPVTKVQATISAFNLNCPRLAGARYAHHRALEREKARQRDVSAWQSLAAHHLTRDLHDRWKPFFTVTRWTLGRIAEKHLRAIDFIG